MRLRTLQCVVGGAALLCLTAGGCFVSEKSVEVPIRDDADMTFISMGVLGADTQLIDFCAELADAEDETGTVQHVEEVVVESLYWRLVENRGDPNTQVTANVTIQRVGGESAVLVPDTTFVLSDVDTVFAPVRVDSTGLALLLEGMNEYAEYWNGGKVGPCPNLTYTFTWTMSATPYANFTWESRVKFTIIATAEVEVPDLWD